MRASKIDLIDKSKIMWIKGEINYSLFFLKDKEYPELISITLKKVESILEPEKFCRIHRSYLVNLQLVTRFNREKKTIRIANQEFQISRRKYTVFHRKYSAILFARKAGSKKMI